MFRKLAFALMFAPLAFGNSSSAASLDDRLEEFKQFLQEYRRDEQIPSLSVALVQDGEIILAEAIGWQDHDAEEPTTAETTYLVASISKTFTAATLLAMEADGHIDLDDDFTKLSDWDGRWPRISVGPDSARCYGR